MPKASSAPFRPEYFWAKVHKTTEMGCWEWQATTTKGYGAYTFLGKAHKAHRVAYELLVGPIPTGLSLLHSCDNRRCVNPSHLRPGTNADNNADMFQKGRYRRGRYPNDKTIRGERNGAAKMTEAKVLAIREEYAAGGIAINALGRKYGLGKGAIWKLIRRVTWAHI